MKTTNNFELGIKMGALTSILLILNDFDCYDDFVELKTNADSLFEKFTKEISADIKSERSN